MSLHHALRAAGSAGPTSDPYFKNTSLLLLGNGSNGGQNNTFVDSSSNNLTITRYGNATQGTFSPFGYSWSNYFNGTSDYLTVANSQLLRFGTGDFTVEAWFFLTGDNGTDGAGNRTASICSCYPAGALTSAWAFFLLGDGTTTGTGLILAAANGGAASGDCTASYSFSKNTWYHIAAVRSSGVIKLYVNGISISYTGSIGSTLDPNVVDTFYIGSSGNSAYKWYFPGYISNFRFVKGSAIYTANFTPPQAPLTSVTNTSVLTCQSNRFIDSSANSLGISRGGSTAVTNFAPFSTGNDYSTATNGGSGYFDGNNSYLIISSNSALAIGNNAFTWELWFYPTVNLSSDKTFLYSGANPGLQFGTQDPSQNRWGFAAPPIAWRITTTTFPITNQWNHLVITRTGTGSNQAAIFMNGVRLTQGTIPDTLAQTDTYINSTSPYGAIGYFGDMRLVNGSSLYDPNSSTYTVPSGPMTSVTNTCMLLSFTNASIIDSTGKNDLQTVGDAQISTSVKKFGTGSLKFDGTDDYLQAASNTTLNFGTGDFTVECWMYLANTTTSKVIISGTASNSFGFRYGAGYNGSAGLGIYRASVADLENCTHTFSANTWYHIAVVRSSGTILFFVDGVQKTTAGSGGASYNFPAEGNVRIGTSDSGGEDFNGYLDDIRVTKVARYTANFTPPSRQLPAR